MIQAKTSFATIGAVVALAGGEAAYAVACPNGSPDRTGTGTTNTGTTTTETTGTTTTGSSTSAVTAAKAKHRAKHRAKRARAGSAAVTISNAIAYLIGVTFSFEKPSAPLPPDSAAIAATRARSAEPPRT